MRSGKPGGGKGALVREDQSLTLAGANDQTLFQPVPFSFQERGREGGRSLEIQENLAYALTAPNGGGRGHERNIASEPFRGLQGEVVVGYEYAVRKLMPIECERLQGFPDGWTEGFADTTRYRMLGNAVAVPVVEWIARRLVAVDAEEAHG